MTGEVKVYNLVSLNQSERLARLLQSQILTPVGKKNIKLDNKVFFSQLIIVIIKSQLQDVYFTIWNKHNYMY